MKTIIVGCSDEYLCWRLANWLRSLGHSVIEADSGAKVLARALELEADLVILDSNIRGIFAQDTCRYLRAQRETSAIPILVLAPANEKETYMKIGASLVIEKNAGREQLLQAAEKLLSPGVPDLNQEILDLSQLVWAKKSIRTSSS